MKPKIVLFTCHILKFLSVWALVHGIAFTNMAMALTASHALTIRLFPERSELEGRDRIRIHGSPGGPLHLSISPRVRLRAIRIDGRDHPYSLSRGRLTLTPAQNPSPLAFDLDIHYICQFDDPAPVRPLNADNPGFGVSGTISPVGTFILPGAGWYPRLANARESFDLRVDGPADTVAVTAGRLVGIDHSGKRTVSRWQIDNPLEGLSLSAGRYVVDRQSENGITAATFLFPENRHLSPRYLEASLGYLKRYSDRFGAYPFNSFSVVENFFPTGYGFPAYTLMGGRILRLPFIPHTSLPHEIVHNWWGNGVLVDSASGNWCEGLTSYTADYLNKANISSDAAMDYRRQALRNFSALVSLKGDFPLSRFRSRTDPITKAVGYDKATMVFHMLHHKIGDAAFWNALRDLYRQLLFKHASWQDLQKIFENRSGRPLEAFFRQWIDRPGAPQIRLKDIRQIAGEGGYRAIGRVVQEKPYFDFTIDLVMETGDGPIRQAVHVSTSQTAFEIPSRTRPRELELEPGSFQAGGQRFNGSIDVLFFVARHPDHSGNIVSLLHPLSPEAADPATVKIPHYGRYSRLAFSDGHNRIKGTWEVKHSPMRVRWETATRP